MAMKPVVLGNCQSKFPPEPPSYILHGGEPFERVHGSILLRVQVGSIAGSTEDVGVALVGGKPDDTSHIVLAEDDRVLDLILCWRA